MGSFCFSPGGWLDDFTTISLLSDNVKEIVYNLSLFFS